MNSWLDPCRRTWGPLLAARRPGANASSESVGLDRHLASCARCRAFAADLDLLRDVLVEAAQREPLDHPEPEDLATLATRPTTLPAADRERLERHLDSCTTCRSEWNVVRGWSPPSIAPRREPGRRPWVWFGAGLATAAAVFSMVLLLPRDGEPGRIDLRPSVGPVQIRGLQHRAGGAPTALRIPSSGDLLVSLTVEAAPGSALRVELLRTDGSVVSIGRLAISDPSGLVFASVPASSVPRAGGGFRVTVEETGETFDYPFRVLVDGD